MSVQKQDVADARRAVSALVAAVERLRGSRPDSVDLRRLAEDVSRVSADLDLLAGPDPGGTLSGPSARDLGYDPREFVDGTYEGTNPPRS